MPPETNVLDPELIAESYNVMRRNQASMQQVTTLLEQEATQVLNVARDFDRNQLGGFLRSVVPGLVDRYGTVNATVAMKYYDEQRLLWRQRNPTAFATSATARRQARQSAQRRAQNYAAARLKSELFVASLPKFDALAKSEPIIGWGMSQFVEDGFDAASSAVRNSLTRAVGSYHRDTIIYNAGLDDAVVAVQRVAEPNACEFCRLVAFQSWRGRESRLSSYAIDFHDNCHCSIETIYEGDQPIRPDYYDEFEQQYEEFYDGTVKGTLTEWRAAIRKSDQ